MSVRLEGSSAWKFRMPLVHFSCPTRDTFELDQVFVLPSSHNGNLSVVALTHLRLWHCPPELRRVTEILRRQNLQRFLYFLACSTLAVLGVYYSAYRL
jgi:hypothetical protein